MRGARLTLPTYCRVCSCFAVWCSTPLALTTTWCSPRMPSSSASTARSCSRSSWLFWQSRLADRRLIGMESRYSMTIQADQHGRQAANWHWVQALICSIYRMMFTSTSRVYQNGFIFCSAKRFRRRHTNPDPWTVRISKCMTSLHYILDSHCAVIA